MQNLKTKSWDLEAVFSIVISIVVTVIVIQNVLIIIGVSPKGWRDD